MDLEGSGDTGDMQEYLKLLIIIGEFSPLGEGQQRNEIVPLELLTKEQQSPEVYIGEKSVREVPGASSEGLKRFMLEVVFEPTAWLYGWNSGRYKTETRHAFQVSVLSPKDDAASDLLRLASFESPSFVINSSRRKKLTRSECVPVYTPEEDDDTSVGPSFKRARTLPKLDLDGPFCQPVSVSVSVSNPTGGEDSGSFAKSQTPVASGQRIEHEPPQIEVYNCSLPPVSVAPDKSMYGMSEAEAVNAAYRSAVDQCCMQAAEYVHEKHDIDPEQHFASFGLDTLSFSPDLFFLDDSDAYNQVSFDEDTSPRTSVDAGSEGGGGDLEVREDENALENYDMLQHFFNLDNHEIQQCLRIFKQFCKSRKHEL